VNLPQFKNKNGKYVINQMVQTRGPVDPTGKAVVGRINMQLSGTIRIQDSKWFFSGTLSPVVDTYDFDPGTNRSKAGEFSTRLGNALGQALNAGTLGGVKPKGYDLIIQGDLSINDNGSF
jgi:hypothetical protein